MFRLFLGATEVTRIEALLTNKITNKELLSGRERFEDGQFDVHRKCVCFKRLTGARKQLRCY